ncbi:MAG: DUF917 domain-containing protein [Actinobacteria bacterium]|nr:DUF917 domain-containing protein [Actinomycetota bacterium]
MPTNVTADQLPLLAAGATFFGSGGGGSPRIVELMLQQRFAESVRTHLPTEIDPRTPCFAPAFAGSTMLLSERLPGTDTFASLLEVAERWIGTRLDAVCALEGGGLNALTPFLFAEDRTVVDADFSGRAVPTLDRLSIFLDRLPGLFVVSSTGGGGINLTQSDRPEDVDQLMRSSILQAGGVGAVIIAGFKVGDLIEHALHGHLGRSLTLGAALAGARGEAPATLAERTDTTLISYGRVLAISQDRSDPHVHTVEVEGANGEVIRLVARSEYLAVLVDGVPTATAPDFIAVVDTLAGETLEVTSLALNQHVAIFTKAGDAWWRSDSHRAQSVSPASYGLEGLQLP